jgi:short-subunit dehydrogenase
MEANRSDRLSWGLLAAGATAGLVLGAKLRQRRRHALRGRVVLITGGSRGLGLELAREIGRRGARVVITARDPEEIGRAVVDLRARGVTVLGIACDVTSSTEIGEMLRHVGRIWEPVQVLVNNAGQIEVGPAEHMVEADHRRLLELHALAPMRLIEAVIPEMRTAGRGQIVNIASVGGLLPLPHMLPYCASKHALVGLSRGDRVELDKYGITVATVAPGMMRTGSSRHATFKGRHRAEFTWFSLLTGLPGLSVSVQSAARQIVHAMERGETEVVIGSLARTGALAHKLAPRVTQALMAGANRLLPGPGRDGNRSWRGEESETLLTRSPLLRWSRRAEVRQGQQRHERRIER